MLDLSARNLDAINQDAITSIAREMHYPLPVVRRVYEIEFARLKADARITDYLIHHHRHVWRECVTRPVLFRLFNAEQKQRLFDNDWMLRRSRDDGDRPVHGLVPGAAENVAKKRERTYFVGHEAYPRHAARDDVRT